MPPQHPTALLPALRKPWLTLLSPLFLRASFQARDPIPQFAKFMVSSGLATEADIKALDEKVRHQRHLLYRRCPLVFPSAESRLSGAGRHRVAAGEQGGCRFWGLAAALCRAGTLRCRGAPPQRVLLHSSPPQVKAEVEDAVEYADNSPKPVRVC